MHQLKREEVDFILDDIRRNGILIEDLQFSLLDHLCCVLENEWQENASFAEQYQLILPRFFKKELSEIQEETELLLTFKHYYAMKKSMIYSGAFSAIGLVIASFFKLMHWPGAGMLIVLSIAFFSFIFLPILFVLKSKEVKMAREKITIGVGTLIGGLFCLSVLFKVMHWPGANFMGVASLLGLFFIFLPLHFFGGIRNVETKTNTIISSVLLFVVGGLMFSLINLRPSVRLEGAIIETNQHMINSIAVTSKVQNQNETSENSILCRSISSDIMQLKQDLTKSVLPEGKASEEELIRDFGSDFGRPTEYLFQENGTPKAALAKIKKDLSVLHSTLQGQNIQALLQLSDRPLHGDKSKGIVTWENEQFYQIPTTLVLANLNQLLMDLNVIRLGVE